MLGRVQDSLKTLLCRSHINPRTLGRVRSVLRAAVVMNLHGDSELTRRRSRYNSVSPAGSNPGAEGCLSARDRAGEAGEEGGLDYQW